MQIDLDRQILLPPNVDTHLRFQNYLFVGTLLPDWCDGCATIAAIGGSALLTDFAGLPWSSSFACSDYSGVWPKPKLYASDFAGVPLYSCNMPRFLLRSRCVIIGPVVNTERA